MSDGRQILVDAIVWFFESILCAAIFSAFVGCFFGDLIEDSGWRLMLIFVLVWLLGAVCAGIDLRHRRRKRREQPLRSP
ncbi:MAG: hypothetical protein NXI14_07055 [bacterium]|nr:hypothetical protein [bacterium]